MTYTPKDVLLKNANQAAVVGKLEAVYTWLGRLSLADYADLIFAGSADYPELDACLPSWPDQDTQKQWVGDSGRSLLLRSTSLARLFHILSYETTGSGLRGRKILDYGCGWGRMTRFMNYFSTPDKVVGVDAMEQSLRHYGNLGMPNRIYLIPGRPETERYSSITETFDFIYLFSVFTHTPKEITVEILQYLRGRIGHRGILACTIRNDDWLSVRVSRWKDEMIGEIRGRFATEGYAFIELPGSGGSLPDSEYGDTILKPEILARWARTARWQLVRVDRDVSEPFQQVCILEPVN
jgi:SAM-dependent methyltransferase